MIADLTPYPALKDSGISGLREVPERWHVRRLKHVCAMRSGEGITAESINSRGEYPVYGGNGLRGYTSSFTHEGAFPLVGRQGALCGNVHLARGRFWASEHAVVASPKQGVSPEFLARALHAMDLGQYSLAAAQPGLAVERVLSLPIPLPPLPEQTAIVRFLDYADRRIRCYIRAKQRLIKLLEEQKQAIIHRAVTRGLDPDVPLKDSGVEWLGEVPEHWEVIALRYRYSQVLGKMLDSKRITGDHLVPYLRNTDVQWDGISCDDLPEMDIPEHAYPRYTLLAGDLLVCEGGEVGRSAVWEGQLALCGFQKALHRLRPRRDERDTPRFMLYALRCASRCGAFDDGHVSTIAHLTGDKLRAHRFPFPPPEEQRAVVGFLDAVQREVGEAKDGVRREVSLLRELRTRLIADVVTGKLDVREVAARLPDEEAAVDEDDHLHEDDPPFEDADLDAELEEIEA